MLAAALGAGLAVVLASCASDDPLGGRMDDSPGALHNRIVERTLQDRTGKDLLARLANAAQVVVDIESAEVMRIANESFPRIDELLRSRDRWLGPGAPHPEELVERLEAMGASHEEALAARTLIDRFTNGMTVELAAEGLPHTEAVDFMVDVMRHSRDFWSEYYAPKCSAEGCGGRGKVDSGSWTILGDAIGGIGGSLLGGPITGILLSATTSVAINEASQNDVAPCPCGCGLANCGCGL